MYNLCTDGDLFLAGKLCMMQSEESCQLHDKEAYPLLSTKYTLCTQGLYNTGTPVDLLYVCECVYT